MLTGRRVSTLLALLLAFVSVDAFAIICTPLNSPQRFVGITDSGSVGYDALCTDNDVNSAIAAIAAGANTCPATIYITHEHDAEHIPQHIVFDNTNRAITLVGLDTGVPCGTTGVQICGDPPCPAPTTPLLTLDGHNTSGSVIHLNGQNSVALTFLTVQNGAAAYTENGGGIYFSGAGSLTLNTTVVQNNYAGYGAGIYFNGTGGNATLTLNSNSLIVGNEAQFSGGGIRVDGMARLFALQDQTILFNNQADGHDPVLNTTVEGYGGGLEVVGPARADIGSGGYNGLGVIYDNTALYGGGAAVFGDEIGGDSALRLFTIDAQHPVRVQGNTATNTGGAIFLRPFIGDSTAEAALCAYDFRMDDNIAQEGTAIYADEDFGNGSQDFIGGSVELNVAPFNSLDPCNGTETPLALGAVACAGGVTCNSLDGNVAEDQFSQPTAGSTILMQNDGELNADRLIMRGNHGAHAIHVIDPGELGSRTIEIFNCLLVDNDLTAELIYAETGPNVFGIYFHNCTMAHNSIGAGFVVYSDIPIGLTRTIVDQPGLPTFSGNGVPAVSYLLSNDITTMPTQSDIIKGEPTFVNVTAGDYHLQATSLGIDFAPATGGSDLDRVPRDIDLAPAPNIFGPRDLGAYERQSVCASDTIFCNSFDAYQ